MNLCHHARSQITALWANYLCKCVCKHLCWYPTALCWNQRKQLSQTQTKCGATPFQRPFQGRKPQTASLTSNQCSQLPPCLWLDWATSWTHYHRVQSSEIHKGELSHCFHQLSQGRVQQSLGMKRMWGNKFAQRVRVDCHTNCTKRCTATAAKTRKYRDRFQQPMYLHRFPQQSREDCRSPPDRRRQHQSHRP